MPHPNHALPLQRAADANELVLQVMPLDVLHHQEIAVVLDECAGHATKVRVAETAKDGALAEKVVDGLLPLIRRELRLTEFLDRAAVTAGRVHRQVDRALAALRQLT